MLSGRGGRVEEFRLKLQDVGLSFVVSRQFELGFLAAR